MTSGMMAARKSNANRILSANQSIFISTTDIISLHFKRNFFLDQRVGTLAGDGGIGQKRGGKVAGHIKSIIPLTGSILMPLEPDWFPFLPASQVAESMTA